MTEHSDKGRYIIACAILEAEPYKYSPQLISTALDCVLAYRP
jgi:hypothetical protein